MRTGIRLPESFIPEIKRCQITVRTKFHIYPMLSDMHISSVGYQLGDSLAVGVVHSLHHPDLLGHFSSPFLRQLCLTLFDHNSLRCPLVLERKIHQNVTLLQLQHYSHSAVPKDLRCQSPPNLKAAYRSNAIQRDQRLI